MQSRCGSLRNLMPVKYFYHFSEIVALPIETQLALQNTSGSWALQLHAVKPDVVFHAKLQYFDTLLKR